jgi:hypothetical protein
MAAQLLARVFPPPSIFFQVHRSEKYFYILYKKDEYIGGRKAGGENF